MDLDTHSRDIWIALGTLSGLGVVIAFIRTWTWYSKSGREVVDLPVRISFFSISLEESSSSLHRHLVNFSCTSSVFSALLFFLFWLVFLSGG